MGDDFNVAATEAGFSATRSGVPAGLRCAGANAFIAATSGAGNVDVEDGDLHAVPTADRARCGIRGPIAPTPVGRVA